MSEYTEFNYGLLPALGVGALAVAAGLAGLAVTGAVAAAGSVTELVRRYEASRDAHQGAGLSTEQARLRALDEVPLLKAAALAELPTATGGAAQQGADLAPADGIPAPALRAPATPELLRGGGLQRGLARLRHAEARLVRDAVGATLTEMGYALRPPRRAEPERLTLRATHADGTVVAVQLDPQRGTGALDLSGFAPGVCIAAREALQDGLRRRGVRLEVAAAVRHDAREGGCLTAALAAADGDTAATPTPHVHRPLPTKAR